jgi:hypothetical protein
VRRAESCIRTILQIAATSGVASFRLPRGVPPRYTLTVRRRGVTDRDRFESLDEALTALETRLDAFARPERRGAERGLSREYAPVMQVAVRGEVAGPGGLRGGVDVRGDGSAEAYTGRVRRRLVDRGAGETAYEALRRALGG